MTKNTKKRSSHSSISYSFHKWKGVLKYNDNHHHDAADIRVFIYHQSGAGQIWGDTGTAHFSALAPFQVVICHHSITTVIVFVSIIHP